jgi:hypothetical protein
MGPATVSSSSVRPPRLWTVSFAFDLSRAEMLGSIQCDQHPPTQTLERRQRSRRLDRLHEQPIERRRRGAVQHQADVVVGGDLQSRGECFCGRRAELPIGRPYVICLGAFARRFAQTDLAVGVGAGWRKSHSGPAVWTLRMDLPRARARRKKLRWMSSHARMPRPVSCS